VVVVVVVVVVVLVVLVVVVVVAVVVVADPVASRLPPFYNRPMPPTPPPRSSPLLLAVLLPALAACPPRHPQPLLPEPDTTPAPPPEADAPASDFSTSLDLADAAPPETTIGPPDSSTPLHPLPPSLRSFSVPSLPLVSPSPVLAFGADWSGTPAPFVGVRVGPRHPRPDPPTRGTHVEIPVDRDGRPTADAPVVHTRQTRFNLDDPAAVVAAFAEARFAGGIIARINGVEWFRSNIDPERSGPADPAASPPPDDPFWIRRLHDGIYQRSFPGLDPTPLRRGENTLSVELHRPADPDADPLLYLDLRLDLFSSHGFVVPPFLTVSTTGAAAVAWQTSTPTTGLVRYGTGPDADLTAPAAPTDCNTRHEVTLPPLPADNQYAYGVAWSPCAPWSPAADRAERWSPAGSVRPLPPPGRPLVFFAYGDSRTYPQRHARVVQAMLRNAETDGPPAFVVNTGDLTDTGTDETAWREQFHQPLAPLLAHTPLAPVLGNHDGQDEDWFERFSLPHNEAWYSFRAGDAEIFILDAYARFAPNTPQLRWLDETLAASTAPWKIVALHLPLRSCMADRRRRRTADNLAAWLAPLLARHHVRLVLAGHDHLYGRSTLDERIVNLTLGGGGAPTYEPRTAADDEVCVAALHFARIELDALRLHVRVLDPDGNTLDEFQLSREPDDSGADSRSPPAVAPAAAAGSAAEGGVDRATTVLDSPPGGNIPCDPASP